MAQVNAKQTAVATKVQAAPPSLDVSSLEAFAGAGSENVTSKDVSLPFLKILSNN